MKMFPKLEVLQGTELKNEFNMGGEDMEFVDQKRSIIILYKFLTKLMKFIMKMFKNLELFQSLILNIILIMFSNQEWYMTINQKHRKSL